MRNVRIAPSRKWKETENNKIALEHEFYSDIQSIYYVVIHIIIWYINTRNKNEIKNGLQSSQQWYILDKYLRFDKKEVLTV